MTYVVANGLRVHYRLEGPLDAPVLLLCHSLGTSMDLWTPQLSAFQRTFRVLRYDVRGHGRTDAPPGPYALEQFATDAIALLDALSIDRVDYCGVSLGGFVGQWLGAKAPHRVRRIVLANTAAALGPPTNWNARIETVQTGGLPAIADASMGRWFSAEFQAREPAVIDTFRRTLLASSADGYIATCAAIRDMNLRALAPHVSRPTLVVAGDRDGVTSRDEGSWLAANIPGAELAVLPSAHLANVEAAEQFNEVVGEFLQRGDMA